MAEDREKFKQAMTRIGLASARSAIAHSMEERCRCSRRWLSHRHSSVFHYGRIRRRHCLQS